MLGDVILCYGSTFDWLGALVKWQGWQDLG